VILIAGIPSEPPLRAAIAATERAGVEHVVVDQRQSGAYELSFDLGGGEPRGILVANGVPVPLEGFTGAYARLMESDVVHKRKATADGEPLAHATALQRGLEEWLEVAPGRIVNRISAMASNVSKPYQAQLVRAAGLATPATLVTNRADEAKAFADAEDGAVFKSVSSVRSIVQVLTPGRRARLGQVRRLPTQFQELVRGVDVRVHVVGQRVFATEIVSEAVDYRYAARDDLDVDMRETAIPADLERRCVKLAETLDLPFCGIDLRRTSNGAFVCFEVNPSPAYTYYEDATGQPISDALIEYLARR